MEMAYSCNRKFYLLYMSELRYIFDHYPMKTNLYHFNFYRSSFISKYKNYIEAKKKFKPVVQEERIYLAY